MIERSCSFCVFFQPITTKETHSGSGNGLAFALSSMQGWRIEMEDAHIAELQCPQFPQLSIFGVFDGHGGSTVSKESATRFVPTVMEQLRIFEKDEEIQRYTRSLRLGLLTLDRDLRKMPRLSTGEDRSGSTAITALVTPTHVFTANCGDSRSILARKGEVKHSTVDHKPVDKTEIDRILKAGGFVELGRVCGNLAVSRALGDYSYKDRPDLGDHEQKITAAADVFNIERHEDDEFLLLACDGIWDVMSNEEAVDFIHDQLKAGTPHEKIAEAMLDHCLIKGSKDNMSVVLVFFENAPKPVPGHQARPLGGASAAAQGPVAQV